MGDLELRYLGWSGFRIAPPDGAIWLIDPPARALAAEKTRPLRILVSHGHPEHVAGTRMFLRHRAAAPEAVVVGSAEICDALRASCTRDDVTFQPVSAGMTWGDGDVRVGVFTWRHLPLLPPGIGPALQHMTRIVRRPKLAARIVSDALDGPRAGPMLGFVISIGDRRIVAYGEGLHRKCTRTEVAAVSRRAGDATWLVAVEPEDEHVLAPLLAAASVRDAVLFEPHAGWRDAFGMARADLGRVARELRTEGVGVRVAERPSPVPPA